MEIIQSVLTNFQSIYFNIWAVRTNNLFLTLFVKIKVLVAYAVPKNYVVVILLIIQMYTALFPFNSRFLPVSPRISTFKDKKASFGGVIGGVSLN